MTIAECPPSAFNRLVLTSPHALAIPLATYPGLALTGARVLDVVTNPNAQLEAQTALQRRYRSPVVMSAMDLSAEAEAFGCQVEMSATEVPTVTGRLVTSLEGAQAISVPPVGHKRTRVYLETTALLRKLSDRLLVLGGCIGPFSLAARLAGVSEAMEMTVAEPELMHTLLQKGTEFLSAYVRAFRSAGADGVLMAEPAAGLLSPRGVATFSSAYIKSIADATAGGGFTIVLHNCGASLVHLPSILETGLRSFHFGAPMDLPAVLANVAPDVVVCGNLDPVSVFCLLQPEEISSRAAAMLRANSDHRNFVLSSGCDVPPDAPLASLDAFYAATAQAKRSGHDVHPNEGR